MYTHAHTRTHAHTQLSLSLYTYERERGTGPVTDVERGAEREQCEERHEAEDKYV